MGVTMGKTAKTLLSAAASICILIAFVRNFPPEVNSGTGNATKVILLASNARSGSTYLSEVLTANDASSAFWFEPLRWLAEDTRLTLEEAQAAKHRGVAGYPFESLHEAKVNNEKHHSKVLFLFFFRPFQLALVPDFLNCRFDRFERMLLSSKSRDNSFRKPQISAWSPNEKGFLIDEMTRRCSQTNFRYASQQRLLCTIHPHR